MPFFQCCPEECHKQIFRREHVQFYSEKGSLAGGAGGGTVEDRSSLCASGYLTRIASLPNAIMHPETTCETLFTTAQPFAGYSS